MTRPNHTSNLKLRIKKFYKKLHEGLRRKLRRTGIYQGRFLKRNGIPTKILKGHLGGYLYKGQHICEISQNCNLGRLYARAWHIFH